MAFTGCPLQRPRRDTSRIGTRPAARGSTKTLWRASARTGIAAVCLINRVMRDYPKQILDRFITGHA